MSNFFEKLHSQSTQAYYYASRKKNKTLNFSILDFSRHD